MGGTASSAQSGKRKTPILDHTGMKIHKGDFTTLELNLNASSIFPLGVLIERTRFDSVQQRLAECQAADTAAF